MNLRHETLSMSSKRKHELIAQYEQGSRSLDNADCDTAETMSMSRERKNNRCQRYQRSILWLHSNLVLDISEIQGFREIIDDHHSAVALNVKSRPVPSLLSSSLKCRCTSHLYSGVVDLAMSTRTKLLLQTFIYGNIDTNIVTDLRQKRSKECPN